MRTEDCCCLSGRCVGTEAVRRSGAPSAVVLVVRGAVERYVESTERRGSLAHVVYSWSRGKRSWCMAFTRRIPNIPPTFVELANGPHSAGWSCTTMVMGRRRVVVAMRRSSTRVMPSHPGWMAAIRASGHLAGGVSSLLMSTRSLTATGR